MVLLIYDSVPDVLYANHLRARTTDDRPGLWHKEMIHQTL